MHNAGSEPAIRDTLRVVLVEAGDLNKVRNWNEGPSTFSNRVSSITNASHSFLGGAQSGVMCCCEGAQGWIKILAHGRVWTRGGHVRSKRCRCAHRSFVLFEVQLMQHAWNQVWDGLSDARITFSMQDDHASILSGGEPQTQLARLTENFNLQRALLRYLDNSKTVELADKVKVQSIVREDREGGGWPLVHLSDGRVLRARLLVSSSRRPTSVVLDHRPRSVQTVSTPQYAHIRAFNHMVGHTTPQLSLPRSSITPGQLSKHPTPWHTNASSLLVLLLSCLSRLLLLLSSGLRSLTSPRHCSLPTPPF